MISSQVSGFLQKLAKAVSLYSPPAGRLGICHHSYSCSRFSSTLTFGEILSWKKLKLLFCLLKEMYQQYFVTVN